MTARRCDACGEDCDSLPGPDGVVICLDCQEDVDGQTEADNPDTVD